MELYLAKMIIIARAISYILQPHQRKTRMTISKRLYFMIALAILGLGGMGGIGLYQLGHVFEAANYGNENSVPSLIVLNRAMKAFGQERVRAYRHVLSTDLATKTEIEAAIAVAQRDVKAAFDAYESLVSDDEDRKLLAVERQEVAEYAAALTEVIDYSRKNQTEQARQMLIKLATAAETVNQAITSHFEYNEKLGKEKALEAVAARNNANRLLLAIIVLTSLATLIVGINIVRGIKGPLNLLIANLNAIANGDLSVRVATEGSDEIADLRRATATTLASLRDTLGTVVAEADTVVASASQLSAAAQQMAASSEHQSQSTSSAAAAVEELTVSIDHVGNNADDASLRAHETGRQAVSSGDEVQAASRQITEVSTRVEASARQIHTLSEQLDQISNVTTVIREVADQTNLLALNAAIEAARAGEQGRGFAVVADEVRKLAERTTLAVQEISAMISGIQTEAGQAVKSMQSSQEVVGGVVESAGRASESMQGIVTATETVLGSINSISEALREQRAASSEMARNVESIAQMSEENSSTAASVAQTAQQLVSVSGNLKRSVSRFRL